MTTEITLSDSPIDFENIRKVWHKGEWYFCVTDMIAEMLKFDYRRAKTYWSTLKARLTKEGNESVTKCDQLKMLARDGKSYKTDVINTEQALRLIQSIPSPNVEDMKLWLASVGAERLQEEEDPELALLVRLGSTADRYKSEGRSNSWIEARITGIVTRKQFVDALKDAVLNAEPTMYAQATDRLYKGLWDRTTAQLRGELNLMPKHNLRDHFGKYGLIYTRLAEEISGDKLNQTETVLLYQAMEIVWEVAKLISQQARATSEMLGMDLVTEKPLLRG
jgi:DNA-damage-inducible protein D